MCEPQEIQMSDTPMSTAEKIFPSMVNSTIWSPRTDQWHPQLHGWTRCSSTTFSRRHNNKSTDPLNYLELVLCPQPVNSTCQYGKEHPIRDDWPKRISEFEFWPISTSRNPKIIRNQLKFQPKAKQQWFFSEWVWAQNAPNVVPQARSSHPIESLLHRTTL